MKRLFLILFVLVPIVTFGQALTGTTPSNTYKDLFHLNHTNLGLDATLRDLYDGAGTISKIQLSTAGVNFTGTLTLGGTNVLISSDSTAIRAYSDALYQAAGTYLIPSDSTSIRAYSASLYQSKGTYLIPSDSTNFRSYSNALYLLITSLGSMGYADSTTFHGSASITTVGTIQAGNWQATSIDTAYTNAVSKIVDAYGVNVTKIAKDYTLAVDTLNDIVSKSFASNQYQAKATYLVPGDTTAFRTHSDNKYQATGTYLIPSDSTAFRTHSDNKYAAAGTTLPDQTGNSGKFLTTNGTVASWAAVPGGGDLLSTNNLSDLTNAATARTNLGLGTMSQADSVSYHGNANITTVGTIGTGTWQGTSIDTAYTNAVSKLTGSNGILVTKNSKDYTISLNAEKSSIGFDSSMVLTTDTLVCFITNRAIVMDSIKVKGWGTSMSVVCKYNYGDGSSLSGTAIITTPSASTSVTTGTVVSSFDNASIPTNNFVWVSFPTITTKPKSLFITFYYH